MCMTWFLRKKKKGGAHWVGNDIMTRGKHYLSHQSLVNLKAKSHKAFVSNRLWKVRSENQHLKSTSIQPKHWVLKIAVDLGGRRFHHFFNLLFWLLLFPLQKGIHRPYCKVLGPRVIDSSHPYPWQGLEERLKAFYSCVLELRCIQTI